MHLKAEKEYIEKQHHSTCKGHQIKLQTLRNDIIRKMALRIFTTTTTDIISSTIYRTGIKDLY